MARSRTQEAPESFLDLPFPAEGLDEARGYGRQRPGTAAAALNVRSFDPATGRQRGASRPCLAKYSSTLLGNGAAAGIQDITAVTIPDTSVTSLMKSTREVQLLVVAGGRLYKNQTQVDASFLTAAAVNVFGDANGLSVYYTDGSTTYKSYSATAGTTATWTASAGSLPTGGGEGARLLVTWRGRTCLSGLRSDPQNWFFSAVNNPLDFDYSPATTVETQAVAGNNSAAGKVGDVINTMIPFSDDLLIFGCDHHVWLMRGDPVAGGRIDKLVEGVGMPFGKPWCQDFAGNVYFFGTRGGVYRMEPGALPVPISAAIHRRLQDVDVDTAVIRLGWDDRAQGLHLFVSSLTSTTECTHYFWEARTDAWWPQRFDDEDMNPKCCHTYDGDDPDDRVLVLGSWDGYLRQFSESATKDDGTRVQSYVVLGPLTSRDMDEVLLKDLQAVLGTSSGDVAWAVYAADTAEQCLADALATGFDEVAPRASGTWSAGRTQTHPARVSGHALYLKLSSDVPWVLENVRARVAGRGKVQRRG